VSKARIPRRTAWAVGAAFATACVVAARREVTYLASPDNGDPRRSAVGTSPLLSPDGNWVAYLGGPADHLAGVRLISALGGTPRIVGIWGAARVVRELSAPTVIVRGALPRGLQPLTDRKPGLSR
jgi:hypothetical protein